MPVVHLSTGKTFETHGGESVLDAALRAGITLPYSCRTGRCGSCKAGLVSGDTSLLHAEMELSDEERAAGSILTCVRTATSDIALAVEDLGDVHLAAARTWPCRLQSIQRVSPDVVRATLRLPPASTFTFVAGQYIDVIGHGGVRRSYSLASARAEAMPLELHVRQVPGGVMSEYWFGQACTNDLLRLHGPLGTFFVRETEGMHLVFLATGTGIAPVKAMLEPWAMNNFIRDALSGREIRVHGEGTSRRSYLYGSDVAAWLLQACLAGQDGAAYNLGGDEPLSHADAAARVGARTTPSPQILLRSHQKDDGRSHDFFPDLGHTAKALGTRVVIDVETAIERTMRWHAGRLAAARRLREQA